MIIKLAIISYRHFVQFMILFFPMNKIKIKTKDLESPWITKGIKKSKKKQRLYSKFLKKRNEKTKKEYQDYKKLFGSIKKW